MSIPQPSKSQSFDHLHSPSSNKQQNENLEQCQAEQQISQARLYMKITNLQKQELFTMVQKNGLTIKEAALRLGIKYATAKTIIYHQRIKKKAKNQKGIKICGYTEKARRGSKLKIISTVANITYSQEYLL